MAKKRSVVSISLDPEIDQEAGIMARRESIPKSMLYRRAIIEYLERQRDKILIEAQRKLKEIEHDFQ